MFIFYDIETTGINPAFDQILQFAAILTDEQLKEIDRFEIRCQLLPWVVPSPSALLVTNTNIGDLRNKNFPTFYEMVTAIHERLTTWSPATFIGYNSISFDELFLHRAFWQTLYPPYLTVTNGNSRFDLLQAIRAFLHFYPDALIVPKKDDGKNTLKLDRLAPINGFHNMNAHDAMGDVEATIFLAKLLVELHPEMWRCLLDRSNKTSVSSILSKGQNILLFENTKGNSAAWFGKVISDSKNSGSQALIATLRYKWSEREQIHDTERCINDFKVNTRTLSFNKSPMVFTLKEAKSFGKICLSMDEIVQSDFIDDNNEFFSKLSYDLNNEKVWPLGIELEQKIYEGFPSKADELLAREFHESPWNERNSIATKFKDYRYKELSDRYFYTDGRDFLNEDAKRKITDLINNRLLSPSQAERSYRSIDDALRETLEIENKNFAPSERIEEIREFLLQLDKQ